LSHIAKERVLQVKWRVCIICISHRMKLDNRKILIGVIALTLLLFPVVAFSTGPLRIALGLLFVIFFPGYTLLSALFPRQDSLGGIERLALSFGLSIAVVPLIGLVLNYTPWGIRLYPILISITLFILITSAVGWYRQRKLPAAERFSVTFKASAINWVGISKLDRGLSVLLAVAIVAALVSLGYAVAAPKQGERFSEFYILGIEGKAEDYPWQVLLGEPVEVVIGAVNHEHLPTSYQVAITIDGVEKKRVDIGVLAHEEKQERRVSIIPRSLGENRKVDFHLYKNGEHEPYFEDPLHLYVDVVTFLVLNAEGKAGEYAEEVGQGEPVELIIGVVNDEYQPTSYRVEIRTDGTLYKAIDTDTLAYREKWRETVSFIPWLQEEEQEIQFWLYESDEAKSYFEIPLTIDIGVLLYPRCVVAKPPPGDRFTEFYVLNASGKSDLYPWQADIGEPVQVIVGIVNHEYERASYRVKIKASGITVKEITTETLTHGDKWEGSVTFTPRMWGKEELVEFWLYKNAEADPYYEIPLYFFIDILPEFYVLSAEGERMAYTERVTLGEPVEVIVGVVNRQHEATTYRVEMKVDGVCVREETTGALNPRERWEKRVSFTPRMWSKQQKVEFWLYKNGEAEPCHEEPVYFHIYVVLPW